MFGVTAVAAAIAFSLGIVYTWTVFSKNIPEEWGWSETHKLTLVAQIPKTGTHMSESAIDISVLDRTTGAEVNRGKPYLELSELTPLNSPEEIQAEIQAAMDRQRRTVV